MRSLLILCIAISLWGGMAYACTSIDDLAWYAGESVGKKVCENYSGCPTGEHKKYCPTFSTAKTYKCKACGHYSLLFTDVCGTDAHDLDSLKNRSSINLEKTIERNQARPENEVTEGNGFWSGCEHLDVINKPYKDKVAEAERNAPKSTSDNCSDSFKSAVVMLAADTPRNPCSVGWAESLLAHCENGAYRTSTICGEAKSIIMSEKGELGEREVFKNGWSTNRRFYEKNTTD